MDFEKTQNDLEDKKTGIENMEDDLIVQEDISIKDKFDRNIFIDKCEDNIQTILSSALEDEELIDFNTLELHRTGKSLFGSVEIDNRKRFFKISKPEEILLELQGYKIANTYPHETIIKHDLEMGYGLLIQDFCEDMNNQNGLLINNINGNLLSEESVDNDVVLEKTAKIFDIIGRTYESTLTKPIKFTGANDKFFIDRMKKGGRIDEFYKGKYFDFHEHEKIKFEDLIKYKIIVNGIESELTIEELLSKAKEELSSNMARYFVLSPGDLTESNISSGGIFFDFEVAGYNSVVQDIAISTYFDYACGHYIIPKYSSVKNSTTNPNNYKPLAFDDLTTFDNSVSVDYNIDESNNVLDINIDFPSPILKSEIMMQYVERVVKRVENLIPMNGHKELISQFKGALLLRIIGVKDLLKFSEKDLVLSLGFIGYFNQSEKSYEKLSEFILDKFISINPKKDDKFNS